MTVGSPRSSDVSGYEPGFTRVDGKRVRHWLPKEPSAPPIPKVVTLDGKAFDASGFK